MKKIFFLLFIFNVFTPHASSEESLSSARKKLTLIFTESPNEYPINELHTYTILEKEQDLLTIIRCEDSIFDMKEVQEVGYREVNNSSEWIDIYGCTKESLYSITLSYSDFNDYI